jgi:hypothetical protein
MRNLPDDKITAIAKSAATANSVNWETVTTAPGFDSTGAEAVVITILLTPGSSEKIRGEPSARTVSDVMQKLADAGEGRFPIVRYEEKGAT